MSNKSERNKDKKLRKELAIKKAKQKKIITAVISAVAVLAVIIVLAVVLYYTVGQQPKADIYSDGSQTIQLFEDGKFTANLSHGVNKSGTYTKTTEGNKIVVEFDVSGDISEGQIVNNTLYFPEEWEDEHAHGNALGSVTVVTFNVNGSTSVGKIENNALHFPEEWEDGHAHGNVLPKK